MEGGSITLQESRGSAGLHHRQQRSWLQLTKVGVRAPDGSASNHSLTSPFLASLLRTTGWEGDTVSEQ